MGKQYNFGRRKTEIIELRLPSDVSKSLQKI